MPQDDARVQVKVMEQAPELAELELVPTVELVTSETGLAKAGEQGLSRAQPDQGASDTLRVSGLGDRLAQRRRAEEEARRQRQRAQARQSRPVHHSD